MWTQKPIDEEYPAGVRRPRWYSTCPHCNTRTIDPISRFRLLEPGRAATCLRCSGKSRLPHWFLGAVLSAVIGGVLFAQSQGFVVDDAVSGFTACIVTFVALSPLSYLVPMVPIERVDGESSSDKYRRMNGTDWVLSKSKRGGS